MGALRQFRQFYWSKVYKIPLPNGTTYVQWIGNLTTIEIEKRHVSRLLMQHISNHGPYRG